MKTKKYKANKLFHKFLKIIANYYLKLLFDFSMENGQLAGLKPPYIIIANHTNFWDPFLLSMCIPEPVFFVTSDAYFRNPILKQLLKLVGAIPKTKNVSDPLSIRGILEVVRGNGIIGIFPEGKRNWDGRTLPLLRPTAKLIKSLNIPVVSILFKGAHLSMPRWSDSTRKGSLTMTLSRVLEPQDIKLLSTEEIFLAISKSLSYDEYDYQRKHLNPYQGHRRAEKLELFLFICPECGSLDRLKSSGNHLHCGNCSYDVIYNTYGFFEIDERELHFDNPRDWNLWQLEQLDSLISSKILSGNSIAIIADSGIIMKTGQKTGALRMEAADGTLSLYADRIEYSIKGLVIQSFSVNDIIGENIQFNNQLEFMNAKISYRYSGKEENLSAYKWVMAIGFVKKYSARIRLHAEE